MPTGTHDIQSLLEVKFPSVKEFDMDTIQQVLQADIAAHNLVTNQMVAEFCDVTTDALRKYGSSITGNMTEVDEYGRSVTRRATAGGTVGFPLKGFQFAVGWTEKWMEIHSPSDMALMTVQAEDAHLRKIRFEIKKAIFMSANYTWKDFLVDEVDLPVKRLLNADGEPIPNGPNGEVFDPATHTHYLVRAGGALAASDVQAQINHVLEHGHTSKVRIAIAKADEATWKALTGFKEYTDIRLSLPLTTTPQALQRLDMDNIDNRAIGLLNEAEVWVKPWGVPNYSFCWSAGDRRKPLAFRQRNSTTRQGLRIAAQLSMFPLNAEYLEAEFGVGVWERSNGAVLYWGGAAYADPTLTE